MVKRQSRIAQSYVQLIPLLGKDFAKELQKSINNALKDINLDGLADSMREAGRVAGRDFRKGLDSGVGSDGVDLNLRDTIQEAGEAGRRAGHDLKNAMDSAIGASGPDLHTERVIDEAGADGKRAGKELANKFEEAVKTATPPQLPNPVPPSAAAAAAAGANAGQAAGQSFSQNFADKLKGLGETVIGAVSIAGIAGLVKKGTSDALAMDVGSKEITASLMITNEADQEKVTSVIKAMYEGAFAETWEEAEVAVENALAGIPGLLQKPQSEIEKTTKKILAMQQAFEIDPNITTATVSQMVSQGFVKDFNEGVDLFSVGLGKVPIALREELFENFDEYSRQFKGAGLSAQASMGLMVDAANKYGKTGLDNFADAIKEVTIQLSNLENTDVTEKLAAIGLDHASIANDIIAGGPGADKAIESVALGILGIEDAAQRATYAVALFGTPLEELGVGNIDESLQEFVLAGDRLGDVSAQAETLSEIMRDNLGTELNSLKNTAEVTFAEVFEPLLEELIPIVKDLLSWIRENKETIQAWIPPILIIASALALIVTAIGVFGGIALIAPIVSAALAAIGGPMLIVAGIIAAIAAAALGIWGWVENWPQISSDLGKIGNFLGNWFGSLFSTIGNFFKTIWTNFGTGIRQGVEGLLLGLRMVWDGFMDGIKMGITGIGQGVLIVMVGALQGVVSAVNWAINIVGEGINWLIEKFNSVVNSLNLPALQIGFRMGKFETPDYVGALMASFNAPVMDTGGDVTGSTIVHMAKNGDPETITNRGLTNRTLEKIEGRLDNEKANGLGGKTEIHIHQLPGMNQKELAEMVVAELDWQNGRR